MKKRMKSYKFWGGVSGGVVLIIQAVLYVFEVEVSNEYINSIIATISTVLVTLGIIDKQEKDTDIIFEIEGEEIDSDKVEITDTKDEEVNNTNEEYDIES